MTMKTLQQLLDEGVEDRHILVRSDFNVPLDEDGNITCLLYTSPSPRD